MQTDALQQNLPLDQIHSLLIYCCHNLTFAVGQDMCMITHDILYHQLKQCMPWHSLRLNRSGLYSLSVTLQSNILLCKIEHANFLSFGFPHQISWQFLWSKLFMRGYLFRASAWDAGNFCWWITLLLWRVGVIDKYPGVLNSVSASETRIWGHKFVILSASYERNKKRCQWKDHIQYTWQLCISHFLVPFRVS